MELKSIVLYDNENVENYLEGTVICHENGLVEGIIASEHDMYIYGDYNRQTGNIELVLMNPFDYPYISETYRGYSSEQAHNYDVFMYDSEGCYDGMCSMCIAPKKVQSVIKDSEIEELKFKVDLYRKTYKERLGVVTKYSGDKELTRQYEDKLRKQKKIHYYL